MGRMQFWGFRNNEPLVARGAMRHGGGDRSSNGQRLKKATRLSQPGAFFRGPDRYKASKRRYENTRNKVPCQELSRECNRSAARRDFPRRGCRMGGCPKYSRGGEMMQEGSVASRESLEILSGYFRRRSNSRAFTIFVGGRSVLKCFRLPVTR